MGQWVMCLWVVCMRGGGCYIMEELRKENELLLRLISSKTRQNQLLFQQYEQLATENKQQAANILNCKAENRELRRQSFTKEPPKYTYAVLNSPRTERLMADLEQTQLQLTAANQKIEALTAQCEALRSQVNKRERLQETQTSETLGMGASSERIQDLERNLLRKEKEMRELTLIMYAKDATAAEIALRQEGKNREIEAMRQQISSLKRERDQKYSQMEGKQEESASKVAEMRREISQLQQRMQAKHQQVAQLQGVIARKAETLEQLSQFMNDQAEQLQNALQIIKSLQQGQTALDHGRKTLQDLQESIKEKQKQLQGLGQRLNQLQARLQEKENSHALAQQVIKHSQAEIASYQQIKDNLTNEIEHYTRQSMLCKQDLARQMQQSEEEHQRQNQGLKLIENQIEEQKKTLQVLRKQVSRVEGQRKQVNRVDGQRQSQAYAQLAEKEESIAAFMDVLQSLQAEIKAKDTQIDDLMAQKQEFLLRAQNLEGQVLTRQTTTIQNASLRAQLAEITKQLIDIKAQNASLQQQANKLAKQLKEKTVRQGGPKQQYIDMLNAVIENIKNQHEESISKLQTKNHIIGELQKRLEDAEQSYHAEITNLRNSIACQEAISYEHLVRTADKKPKQPPRDIQQEEFDQLLQEIDALRGQLQQKDKQLQEMRRQLDREDIRALQDNNSRPISNIKPVLDSHVYELQDDSPSQIELENESLHETIEDQTYTILELQDKLMRTENAHSAQVVNLRRNIAQLNAEVLLLKRTIYELNPKAMDLTAFVSPLQTKRDKPIPRPSPKRPTSPHTATTAYSQQHKKPPVPTSLPVPMSIPSATRSNPYIAMLTTQKGQLRVPQSGCWSIQELRDLIQ